MRSRSSARTIPVSRHMTSSEIATSAVTTAGISRFSPRTYWMSSTAAGDSIAAVSSPIRHELTRSLAARRGSASSRIDGCSAAAPKRTYESIHVASTPPPAV